MSSSALWLLSEGNTGDEDDDELLEHVSKKLKLEEGQDTAMVTVSSATTGGRLTEEMVPLLSAATKCVVLELKWPATLENLEEVCNALSNQVLLSGRVPLTLTCSDKLLELELHADSKDKDNAATMVTRLEIRCDHLMVDLALQEWNRVALKLLTLPGIQKVLLKPGHSLFGESIRTLWDSRRTVPSLQSLHVQDDSNANYGSFLEAQSLANALRLHSSINSSLPWLPRMDTLSLEDVTVSRKDLVALCQSLHDNRSLRQCSLKISQVSPGFQNDQDPWEPLVELLKHNRYLRRLQYTLLKTGAVVSSSHRAAYYNVRYAALKAALAESHIFVLVLDPPIFDDTTANLRPGLFPQVVAQDDPPGQNRPDWANPVVLANNGQVFFENNNNNNNDLFPGVFDGDDDDDQLPDADDEDEEDNNNNNDPLQGAFDVDDDDQFPDDGEDEEEEDDNEVIEGLLQPPYDHAAIDKDIENKKHHPEIQKLLDKNFCRDDVNPEDCLNFLLHILEEESKQRNVERSIFVATRLFRIMREIPDVMVKLMN